MYSALFLFIGLIVAASFLFGGWTIKLKNDLEREKIHAASGDRSLGTGELRDMIQDVMLEGLAPLEERLELIERSVRQLPAHSPGSADQDDRSKA